MSKKFIPNGDLDFVTMAERFARTVAAEPARFEIAQDDADALSAAVVRFRTAFQACRSSARSAVTTRAKEAAREETEAIVRRLGHLVRSNLRLDCTAKIALGIKQRAEKAKMIPCPQEPPRLKFVRALHEGNGATPVHELDFRSMQWTVAKPPGAVRLELFVDLIPPDEQIPTHPGANHNSRPWYLRSFSRSPIKLIPPMTRLPMRVIYWGRWADSVGNVGPFSATAVAWIEGGSSHYLPGGVAMTPGARKPELMLEDASEPAGRAPTISVLVLEAQYQSFHPQRVVEPAARISMIDAPDARRLEGPAAEEAA